MGTQRLVAFDLGAESGRAILGTLTGGKLKLDVRHRFSNTPVRLNGHLHWNLPSLFAELKIGLGKIASESRAALHGIGIDTWGVDFGLVAKNGELLGLPYHYRDGRNEGMPQKAFAKVSRQEIFGVTGIQVMQINTLYQLMAMKLDRSPLLEAAQTLLFTPDLLNYLFTGQRVTEYSIASTSQMLDAAKKQWAKPLLEKLGLPTRLLQRPVPSGTVVGPLRGDIQEECGCGPIPVIAPGGHDTASAVAAVPAQGANDWCYISSGTWSLMGVELDRPVINELSQKYNFTNEGGVGGKIRFLKNIMGLWLVQECRRHWLAQGDEYDYATLTNLADKAQPFAALVDVDDAPFLSPGQMPEKIARYCRQSRQKAPQNVGATVRCCLESLALTYRNTVQRLEEMLGRSLQVIHIVGGGGQNELLNQMTADACGKTVLAGPVEATSIGNILTQAMALGVLSDLADIRKVVRASFPLKTYEPKNAAAWAEAAARMHSLQQH